jgi:23S rRNA (guanosine2251-2'-O)-methyltransferase
MAILSGVNPVIESLKAGHPLERILIAKGAGGPRLQQIIDMARRAAVPVRFEERAGLDRLAGTPAHQGVVALGASKQYAELDDVAPAAELLVILDGVEDPHNLGAIIRTAYAAGAGAVIIPERRAVGLTDVVAKAAAGALEYLPIVRAGNINRALEQLKGQGYWIYGLDERGTEAYDRIDYASRAVLVFGAEGKGLHELVSKHCDVLVRIPMDGKIPSLNVSVAAGIVLFEWKRRRARTS